MDLRETSGLSKLVKPGDVDVVIQGMLRGRHYEFDQSFEFLPEEALQSGHFEQDGRQVIGQETDVDESAFAEKIALEDPVSPGADPVTVAEVGDQCESVFRRDLMGLFQQQLSEGKYAKELNRISFGADMRVRDLNDLKLKAAKPEHGYADDNAKMALLAEIQRCERVKLSANLEHHFSDPMTFSFVMNKRTKGSLTVVRDRGQANEQSRTVTVSTRPDRPWITHFGFVFADGKGQEWFTLDDGNGSFIVTEGHESDYADIPAVLWTKPVCDSFGLTAGLGVDLENPTPLVGVSWLVGDNFTLSLLGGFRKFETLDGRYYEGQALTADLVDGTLTREEYAPTVALGFGFRFDLAQSGN